MQGTFHWYGSFSHWHLMGAHWHLMGARPFRCTALHDSTNLQRGTAGRVRHGRTAAHLLGWASDLMAQQRSSTTSSCADVHAIVSDERATRRGAMGHPVSRSVCCVCEEGGGVHVVRWHAVHRWPLAD